MLNIIHYKLLLPFFSVFTCFFLTFVYKNTKVKKNSLFSVYNISLCSYFEFFIYLSTIYNISHSYKTITINVYD